MIFGRFQIRICIGIAIAVLAFEGTFLGAFHLWDGPLNRFCGLLYDNYFELSPELEQWRRNCLQRSAQLKHADSKQILAAARQLLDEFHVSHVGLYEPAETEEIWTSESNTTGILSQFVEGELLIFRVFANSAADKAGLKRGDQILSINNDVPSTYEAQKSGGEFLIRRNSKDFLVSVAPMKFERDQSLKLINLNSQWRLLRVESFRKEFFEWSVLNKLFRNERYQPYKWVVDLRGNSGGNFVAGLRLLSYFLCRPQRIGYLERPRQENLEITTLVDNLNDAQQIASLENSFQLELETFTPAFCLAEPKRLVVLVDRETASTSELVAQAFYELSNADVFGEPSSGELLVSVWYPMLEWGEGVNLSIPEAIYVSAKGHQIEGLGVSLSETLEWTKMGIKSGHDEWLEKSMQY